MIQRPPRSTPRSHSSPTRRSSDLLPEATTVPSDAAIIIDTGSTVQKATPQKIVDVARPIASQTEAERGADNAKAMTPLRARHYIDNPGDRQSAAEGKSAYVRECPGVQLIVKRKKRGITRQKQL